jgi:hypothetical protein
MKDHRLRQPLDPDYMHALGTATFCFAICEWNAVYCADRIRPGALRAFTEDELTAGKIAKKLTDLVRNMSKSKLRDQLLVAAQEFTAVVRLRNTILHAKPCTGPNGKARLSSRKVLEIPDLEDAPDEFSACSSKLNELLHGPLSSYKPTQKVIPN